MIWNRWRLAWARHAEARALARRPIPAGLWKRTLVRYPFLRRRDDPAAAELLRLTRLFLDRKEFTAEGGLRLRDDMVVAIAAQACLPILRLGLERYDGFVGIVVHPDQVRARRSVEDDDGVVHEYDEVLSGEAVQGGPVMLSWRDVRGAGESAAVGYNVVIHEFAHVLDMADGLANGVPALAGDIRPAEWSATFSREYEAFQAAVGAGRETLLDPYAAQGPEEFFAVVSESFFVDPAQLLATHPALYALLARYYRQDPAAEALPRRGRAAAPSPTKLGA